MDQHREVLNRALALGQERHGDAPIEHHFAFANSVAYAVAGWRGGCATGPSMREYWAEKLICQDGTPAKIVFDRAVEICQRVCYGPMTLETARMSLWNHCFDDAPEDEAEAMRLLQEAGEDQDDLI